MEGVRYNSLDVHYPSVLTTYYATGQWIEENQDKSRFYIADQGEDTQTLIFVGVVSKTRDIEGTFFRADPSKGPDLG